MEDLSNLRVVDLKERLKELDLPVSGKKAELIERLSQALQASVRKFGNSVLTLRPPLMLAPNIAPAMHFAVY